MANRYKTGEVVFVKGDSYEYQRITRIMAWQEDGMTEVETYNPRWSGRERTRIRNIRKLTKKERGL